VVKREHPIRLGKNITNELDVETPMQCKGCGSVWKREITWTRGKRVIKRRVVCAQCGKRQYGRRAQI
jgi:hypothetical protein